MAGDPLSKKAIFTESGIHLSGYLQWRSHLTAAALGRPEEHFLESKDQQIKAIKHCSAVYHCPLAEKTGRDSVCNLR